MQRDRRAVELVSQHLADPVSAEQCQELLRQLHKRQQSSRGADSGTLGRLAWLVCRLLILWAFASVSLRCLENSFPIVSNSVRTGRALSYLNLVYLKSYRWLSVQLGAYKSEFLHSRDREACLVPNPFYREPELCCGCKKLKKIPRVALNNEAGRAAYRRSIDRHIVPFHVIDSGHRPVSFAELRRTVLEAWSEVSAGSNRVASGPAGGPSTLSELLQSEVPPANVELVSWIFGHMSAIRAVRKLVPRPPFIVPDSEIGLARGFYLLAGEPGSAEDKYIGDLSEFNGQVVLMGLHGVLRVTLSHKPACCPGNHGNTSVVLSAGQAVVVPASCYRVHFSRLAGPHAEPYSLVYALTTFSSTGIKQPAPITGRVPETDDVEDD
uniref:Uncharacterized protein n=1 Tax=Macrostomum lignano TaxID=282301 RepID=A0A1I8GJ84_9PLAT